MCAWIQTGTEADLFRLLRHTIHNLVEDLVFDIEPGTSAATLAMIEEYGARRSGNRCVEIGIAEDQVGRLASQFQRYLLQVAGSCLQNQFANLRRTGERNFVDIRMCCKRSACGFAKTGYHV